MTMYYQQKRLRATQIHVEVGVNDMKRQLLLPTFTIDKVLHVCRQILFVPMQSI